nr:hypothetical protein [Tanacetum cinerariifolium]
MHLLCFVKQRGAVGCDYRAMNAVSLRPKKVFKDPNYRHQRIQLELELVLCLADPTYIRSATPKHIRYLIQVDGFANDEVKSICKKSLSDGAYIHICGDAKVMAQVVPLILQIIMQEEVTDIHKETKIRKKPDKTEHEIGKSEKSRSRDYFAKWANPSPK